MSVRAAGNEVRRNHTAAGRVPGGAILEKALTTQVAKDSTLTLVLSQADFTTARRIAEQINLSFGNTLAFASDGSSVIVAIPDSSQQDGKLVEFISRIELLEITPDVAAKVVINERTGTIVVGGNVGILPVAISHGGLNIEIQSVPVVSQPNPFAPGETILTQLTTVAAGTDTSSVVALEGTASVQDVARALNALRVSPRDIIAIFQALKEAGALKAELIII
jgi:flagellar P-ring protein precursor FlgI